MGLVRVTAYPSKYVHEEYMDEDAWGEESSVGKFRLRFDLHKAGSRCSASAAQRQRELAEVIGTAMFVKPAYERRGDCYSVGGWFIRAHTFDTSLSMGSGLFGINELAKYLRMLDALQSAGYVPDEEIIICFTPDVYDSKLVLNLCNIMEVRNTLIRQALGLNDEIRIVVDEDLAFGIPLSAFSFEKIEACVYLLRQASLVAANTGKSRMKPCDGSNPKYQMRTWLLRLGFIGDQFARPRRTLLDGLAGNCAFFSDDGKEKAAMKRKSKRMAG